MENKQTLLNSSLELLIIGAASLMVLLVALVRVYSRARFANYQVKFQQVMSLGIIAGFITLSISNQVAPQLLLVFVPPLAFFTTHYILEMRRRVWAEIFTVLLFVLVVGWSYTVFVSPAFLKNVVSFDRYFVEQNLLPQNLHGKKIWVIGDSKSYYANGSLGTKYLNWDLSMSEVTELGFYENVENVFNNINRERPEVIVDLHGVMTKLIERVPEMNERYLKVTGSPYYLIKE